MTINFKVDEEKCIHCGLCIKDCMPKVLTFNENKIPQVIDEREKNCMKCQHCLCICPAGAISILDKSPENSFECQNNFNADEILQLIEQRRSVRYYKKQNVDEETVKKLKNMLHYVPTGVNNHNLRFTFVENIEVMDKIREKVGKTIISLVENQKWAKKQFGRYLKPILNGEDIIFRGAPHMIVVSTPKNAPCKGIDPIISLSYFELYAKSLGLGTCWCGLAYYCFKFIPQLKYILNIPKTHELGYVMLFGYPEFEYKRTPQPLEYNIETIDEMPKEKVSLLSKIFGSSKDEERK